MNKLIGLLVLGFVMITGSNTYAQTVQEAQQQVKTYLDSIQYWRYQYSPEDSGVDPNASKMDSVLYMNKLLVNYLEDAGKSSSILKGNFQATDEDEIKIASSADGKLRVYSWDTETGDEMHIYNAVLQYEVPGGAKTKVLYSIEKLESAEHGFLYPDIITVEGAKKYYLLVYKAILSSQDAMKGVRAFTIENNELADAGIFSEKAGMTNKVEYTYDYFSNYDYKKMQEKQDINLKKGKLYIPLSESGRINGKWNVYKFANDTFVLD